MKAKIEIEIVFESWFEDGQQPKNKEEWTDFFQQHFIPEGAVIGDDPDRLINIDEVSLKVKKISE